MRKSILLRLEEEDYLLLRRAAEAARLPLVTWIRHELVKLARIQLGQETKRGEKNGDKKEVRG